MPEEAASTDTTQTSTTSSGDAAGEGQGFEPITSQDQLNHVLGERLARERAKYADYADLKAKAAKFDEAEEASKTELQKLQEQAARADQRATSAEQAMLRLQACTTAGLPASMAARLQGNTADELAADAAELAKLIKPQTPGLHLTQEPQAGKPGDSKTAAAREFFGI